MPKIERRASAAGFASKEDYLVELVRADCEQSDLDLVLEQRLGGPFAPLESDWKQQVRSAAQRGG